MRKPFIFLGILSVLIVIFFFIYLPTISRYRNLKIQHDDITREIEALDAKIQGLNKEKYLLENDRQYLEKVIRDEMGLVRPGEVVYKFIEEKVTPKKQEHVSEAPATP